MSIRRFSIKIWKNNVINILLLYRRLFFEKDFFILFCSILSLSILFSEEKIKTSNEQLVEAIEANDFFAVKKCVESGADVKSGSLEWGTPLGLACETGNLEIVRFLIASVANVNDLHYGMAPLQYACDMDNLELVEILTKAGADVNAETFFRGCTSMSSAIENENLEIVKILVSSGANVNVESWILLSKTCSNGNLEIAKFLMSYGVDVNVSDEFGRTALMYAALFGNKDICSLLIANGADVNAKDINGNSASVYACISTFGRLSELDDSLLVLLRREGAEGSDNEILSRAFVYIYKNDGFKRGGFQSFSSNKTVTEGLWGEISLKINYISKEDDGEYFISTMINDDKRNMFLRSYYMPEFYEGDTIEADVFIYSISDYGIYAYLLNNIYYKK